MFGLLVHDHLKLFSCAVIRLFVSVSGCLQLAINGNSRSWNAVVSFMLVFASCNVIWFWIGLLLCNLVLLWAYLGEVLECGIVWVVRLKMGDCYSILNNRLGCLCGIFSLFPLPDTLDLLDTGDPVSLVQYCWGVMINYHDHRARVRMLAINVASWSPALALFSVMPVAILPYLWSVLVRGLLWVARKYTERHGYHAASLLFIEAFPYSECAAWL